MPRAPDVLLAILALAACGEADPGDAAPHESDAPDTYDPTPPGDDDTEPPVREPRPACVVPVGPGLAGVCDHSVNEADVYVTTTGARPLVLEVRASDASPPGGFHGPGFGNRALAGFHAYDRLPLADLVEIRFVAKPVHAAQSPEIALQVDLTCDGGPLALAQVQAHHFLDVTSSADGTRTFVAPATQRIWTAAARVAAPDEPEAVVLDAGAAVEVVPRTLQPLLEAWPAACLRNLDGGFADLPAERVASGVLLTLGSRNVYGTGAAGRVTRVEIAGDVHLPP